MGNSVERTRNYATIVYPESAPDNWIDILSDLHIPAFVSPFHNSDLDARGKHKKDHYHVMIMFDNVKTKEQAIEVFDKINGVGCEKINSPRAYARYLCHLDDYNKHTYDVKDVLAFGGADYMTLIGTMSDKMLAIRQMIQYIQEENIISYARLVEYAINNNEMWFDALANCCSYFIKEYIKSRCWEHSIVSE